MGEWETLHRGWRHKVKLKDIIDLGWNYPTPAQTALAARQMHERLEAFRLAEYPADEELEQISDEFHTIGFVDGDENAECDYFNNVLSGLYDWADATRVWID